MDASETPIIEIHGHLVTDASAHVYSNSFTQRENILIRFFVTFFVTFFVQIVSFLYKYYALIQPIIGIKDEATLRFYKNHIGLDVTTSRFWIITHKQEHRTIPWSQVTSIHGDETHLLYLFKMYNVSINGPKTSHCIINLGSIPKKTFLQMTERLNALSLSQAIRQQIVTTSPGRFRGKALSLPAVITVGITLVVTGIGGIFLYEPQFTLETEQPSKKRPEQLRESDEQGLTEWQQALEREETRLDALAASYRQVLFVLPQNLEAQKNLSQLAENYVELAKKADHYQWLDASLRLLTKAKQINPAIEIETFSEEKIPRLHQSSESTATNRPAIIKIKKVIPVKKRYSWLVDNGDGTITDTRTLLIGLKKPCFDKNQWEQAMFVVSRLADGICGLSDGSKAGDWRLPSKEELSILVEWERDGAFTVEKGLSYWSATTYASDTSLAWLIYPRDGYINHHNKNNYYYYVWPVRKKDASHP